MTTVFPVRLKPSSSRLVRAGGWRRRLSLVMVLAAWLLATGSHWDLVQTFAWGRMIATYSQTMPVLQAVKLTFTPNNMCGVCTAVSEARQHQDEGATLPSEGKLTGKILLMFQPAVRILAALPAVSAGTLIDRTGLQGIDRTAPPVPPPRGQA